MSPREQLSRREIIVATMVWQGKTNPEIAACLGSTDQVVKNQFAWGIRQAGRVEPAGAGAVRGFARGHELG